MKDKHTVGGEVARNGHTMEFVIVIRFDSEYTFSCPFFLFQPPKLPLPNIELTLKRYLNAVETFTPPDQFSATSKLVQAQYIYWDSKLLANN